MPTIAFAPVNIVHVAFITLCLLGITLIVGERRYKALILLFSVCAIQQLLNILEELNITRPYILITPAIQMAIGPLYYLFVKNLLYGDIKIKQESIHLLPTLFAIAFTQWWPAVLGAAFAWFAVYFFFAFRSLNRYQKALNEFTASDEFQAFTWIQKIFTVICAIEILDFIRLNLQLVLNKQILLYGYLLSACVMFCTVSYLLVRAVRQPQLYSGLGEIEELERKKIAVAKEANEKAEAIAIFANISAWVQQEQRFKQPKYSLKILASELGLSEQIVSWAINQGGGLSFSDYINGLRIDWLIPEFQSSKTKSNILDMAFSAGFNSKSTFNAAFKRKLSCTPSEYLKSL